MNHDCSTNENVSLLLVVILLPFALLVVSGDLVVHYCSRKINWEKSGV